MRGTLRGTGRVLAWFAFAALLVTDLAAADPKTEKRRGPPSGALAASAPAPRVQVAVDSLLDRRTTADFPHSGLTLSLALQGDDAGAVKAVRPRVSRAVDDTGKSVAEPSGTILRGADGWQEARGGGTVSAELDLGSSPRKAKALSAVEGTLEMYLPSRDPAATVKIDRILSKKDKPLTIPVLASQKIHLRVLTKAGLDREKKDAEAKKKKAQSGKKRGGGKKDGVEGMADAMADVLVNAIEGLFSTVGENDLILKVDDPGDKIFSFDLAAADGTPIQSYATTKLEGFRIMRLFEPIPAAASLQVRLKTPKSFVEMPFALADVKLP
ncbi:MAG: hypothetical protein ABJC07_07835 [Acidobacteriota bacterium]